MEETRADNRIKSISICAGGHGHVAGAASGQLSHRNTCRLVLKSACIAGNTADPEAVISRLNLNILRLAVRKFFTSEAAARDTAQAVAVVSCRDASCGRAADYRSHLQTAAHETGVRSVIRNVDIGAGAAVFQSTHHAGSCHGSVHPLPAQFAFMGRDHRILHGHVRNGGAEGVSDSRGYHGGTVHNCVFYFEVSDLRIGDAAKQAHAPAFGLIDHQVGNRMSLPVKGAGKSIVQIRHFSFFSLCAGLYKASERSPLFSSQINIRRQHIIAREEVVYRLQFIHCRDLNDVRAFFRLCLSGHRGIHGYSCEHGSQHQHYMTFFHSFFLPFLYAVS